MNTDDNTTSWHDLRDQLTTDQVAHLETFERDARGESAEVADCLLVMAREHARRNLDDAAQFGHLPTRGRRSEGLPLGGQRNRALVATLRGHSARRRAADRLKAVPQQGRRRHRGCAARRRLNRTVRLRRGQRSGVDGGVCAGSRRLAERCGRRAGPTVMTTDTQGRHQDRQDGNSRGEALRKRAAAQGLRAPHRHAELFRAPLLKRTASRWARVSPS